MTNGGYPTQALIRFNVSFASTNRPSATSIGWRSCLATFGPSQSARSRRIPILRLALPMRALTTLWFACMIKETSRRGVGSALFSGMIAASFLGIFLIPLLYFVFQRMRENVDSGASTPARGET